MTSLVQILAFVFNLFLLVYSHVVIEKIPVCSYGAHCFGRAVVVTMAVAAPAATLLMMYLQWKKRDTLDFVRLFMRRRELAMQRAILEDEKRIAELKKS